MYGNSSWYDCEGLSDMWKECEDSDYINLFGTWKVDERLVRLEELVIEQYNLVEDMSNRQSADSWKGFYALHEDTYSPEEIKSTRKFVQLKGVRYD